MKLVLLANALGLAGSCAFFAWGSAATEKTLSTLAAVVVALLFLVALCLLLAAGLGRRSYK